MCYGRTDGHSDAGKNDPQLFHRFMVKEVMEVCAREAAAPSKTSEYPLQHPPLEDDDNNNEKDDDDDDVVSVQVLGGEQNSKSCCNLG